MPRLLAPSISSTSRERPSAISLASRIVFGKIDLRTARAVQAFGENSREGRLARAARADEQISVGDPVLLDGVGQGLGDMFLADDIRKPLRAIFSGYDLVGHSELVFVQSIRVDIGVSLRDFKSRDWETEKPG